MEILNSLFWLFLLISFLSPLFQRQVLEMARARSIQALERRRNSRLITLIHRQEAIALLGLPLSRYIDIDDSEQVLRAIRLTDPQVPIDLVLHTPGGLVLAAEQIAEALLRHPAKVTVFVPHYAMSGGTLIALAADEIVMDANAVLGPVDPQLGQYPAVSILKVLEQKPIEKIDDETLIMADQARKALAQVKATAQNLLRKHLDEAQAEAIAARLSQGTWTHDYPISAEEARAMGLPISTEMPPEVYALMELYPQPRGNRPSVQYVPLPYRREGPRAR
ncbi:MAG: ATP-dependent Clp protease proteolytic subunit [Meiothermus sp.]|uniref:SDH family Clp fold serine proteinase n=1 Tax=Meiothermus sp. TaxID=1955249 RepID=UPI0025E64893|nr:ATP-dependent Clp protease proteolytic subunit [Meiothermus sp.]MCS7195580.1 ATP-dependent Clp protease proteolytic subunit [Meiothermus sp.]MDW8091933.1 ATP-dependent Clp protease proteolytic subunit [Meiothermus sp.]MDW8480992.1 ATP-dependent Clp protease proteolytic subunit [Meiothermus sp.]